MVPRNDMLSTQIFITLGEIVKGNIGDKLSEYGDDPKQGLKCAEDELASNLDNIFLPLIPDLIKSEKNDEQNKWIIKNLNYSGFLDEYRAAEEYWPTFVFPHFRGSIVSGQRETGFIVSERALGIDTKISENNVYRYLQYFHIAYVSVFGLGNTITEKVAKAIDNPDNALFKRVDQKNTISIVLEIYATESNVLIEKVGDCTIVHIKIGKIICKALEGKINIVDKFIDINESGFLEREKKIDRDDDVYNENRSYDDLSMSMLKIRNYAKQYLLYDQPKEKELLIRLSNLFIKGEILEIADDYQWTVEEDNEIESILISIQALLIYCSVLKKRNYTIGLFYIPPVKNTEQKSIYPRFSAACFWQTKIDNKAVKMFGDIIRDGYLRIQGFIEERLYNARKNVKKLKEIGIDRLGKEIFKKVEKNWANNGVELLETHYLLAIEVAKKLSEISKHEGEILEFALIFGRKYHVETIFPSVYQIREDEEYKYRVTISNDRKKICGIHNVVSRILGHYAIFSKTNVALFWKFDYLNKQESISFTNIVMLEEATGHKISIRQVPSPIEYSTSEKIKKATKLYPEILALIVSGVGRVRAFQSGKEFLEYQAKEWMILDGGYNEFAAKLGAKIRSKYPGKWEDDNIYVLTEIIKLISETSGKGATFIIGDRNKLENGDRVSIPATDLIYYIEGQELLKKENIGLLFQLAIMDGATIIDSNTLKVFGRRQLPVFDWRHKGYEQKWAKGGDLEWPSYEKVYRWGIRHMSALGITEKDNGLLAIVISSDGPISIFEDRKGIDGLSYPPIKNEME